MHAQSRQFRQDRQGAEVFALNTKLFSKVPFFSIFVRYRVFPPARSQAFSPVGGLIEQLVAHETSAGQGDASGPVYEYFDLQSGFFTDVGDVLQAAFP